MKSTETASEIGEAIPPPGIRLPCLTGYMRPERMSLTGAVIGASILELSRNRPLINYLCVNILSTYWVAEGDDKTGKGISAPDMKLNKPHIEFWSNITSRSSSTFQKRRSRASTAT